jgi:hypothetical protein
MAINANIANLATIDEVVLDAFKKAGLLPIEFGIGSDVQWTSKAAHGRRTLNRLMASFSTHRFFEYFVNLDYLDLAAGEGVYNLDADVLNVIDDGSYIPASNDPEEEETTGETPVRPISAFRWNQLSAKTATGTPTLYMLERNANNITTGQLLIRVWPIPSEDGKIRFRTHRIPGSSSVGSDNPDFKRHWELWAVYALAYELMVDSSSPLDARDRMKRDRDEAWEIIKAYDTNNTPPDVVFVHSTPWSGRCL